MKAVELNKQLIENKAGWLAAENPISEMPPANRKFLLGATPPANYVAPPSSMPAAFAGAAAIPASLDWRSNSGNHVTSVKNQGGCGSCVGFGITAVVESMISIEHGMLLNLSEADAFFCSSHGASCNGWWPADAFQANLARGICQEVLFPYASAFPGGNIWTPPPTCIINPKRTTNAFTYGSSIYSTANVLDAKTYLANFGPLTACFAVYQDFYSYKAGVYTHQTGPLEGYHCVQVIGYNDAEGCWICKNSWDTTWGDSGFFKIAYGQCQIDDFAKNGVSGTVLPSCIYAAIGSVQFPNVFLRMDGTGVTQPSGSGSGTVNCQFTAGPWEQFVLAKQSTGNYTIGSVQFPNVFLRMDGTGVTQPSGSGSGTVNCQFTAGPWEQFVLAKQSTGNYTIGSVQFPNVFLRMDGTGVTQPSGSGSGTVNCQFTAGPWEQFMIVNPT